METSTKLNQNEIDEIHNMPEHIVVIVSNDGKIIKTNVSQGRILGWDTEEVVGVTFQKLIHEEDHAQVYEKVSSLIRGKEISINISTRCFHKNGSLRLISWTAISKEGSIYAMGTDTTKYIETENALIRRTRSQKKLQTRHLICKLILL